MTTSTKLSAKDIDHHLNKCIPSEHSIRFSGEAFLVRAKVLAQKLDDPQEKITVVHIAGTSGKGSTAFMIATLLNASGQKSGLFTSPHLTHVRERFVIGGEMISEEKFAHYFDDVMRAAYTMRNERDELPSYFEVLTILAYHIFVQEGCSYAVMETGMGGRFDATNIVDRADKFAVITPIGLDHMKYLGSTVEKIAGEKAGIIQEGNHVIMAPQDAIVRKVIKERAISVDASLDVVYKNDLQEIEINENGTTFWCKADGQEVNYRIGLIGPHQALNASVALRTVRSLAQRDEFELCDVAQALAREQFPGRFEIKKIQDKTIIFDGAHNPQKMTALVQTFVKLYPHEKCTVVFSAKQQKDFSGMLTLLTPITDQLIITQFGQSKQDYHAMSLDADEVATEAKNIGYEKLDVEPALELAVKKALKKDNKKILVTGSLYLVGEMRSIVK